MKSTIQSGNPNVWLVGKACAFATAMVAASIAYASPTVTIDSVAQRWPWNNNVDITYTVNDGLDMAKAATGEDSYYKIVFDAEVGGQTYTIDGSKDIIAPVTDGQHTITWTNTPSGIRDMNCSMGATILTTDAYYMIVDLTTGAWAVDDLEDGDSANATPTNSVARYAGTSADYNTKTEYMTDKLVLRRIPRTTETGSPYSSGYPTGDSGQSGYSNEKNSPTNWVTSKDYFIGMFTLTRAQYNRIMGNDVSYEYPECARPIVTSWQGIRNSKRPTAALDSNASSTSALERLNALTGLSGFDLPTEVMLEIAARAGDTTTYAYGLNSISATIVKNYTAYSESDSYRAVNDATGKHPALSNKWGLFQVMGNGYKLCRDSYGRPDMADALDPWTPYDDASATKVIMRDGPERGDANTTSVGWKISRRRGLEKSSGFPVRISFVAQ